MEIIAFMLLVTAFIFCPAPFLIIVLLLMLGFLFGAMYDITQIKMVREFINDPLHYDCIPSWISRKKR